VDLSKLTTSDKIIAPAGLVLFLSSFMAWFTVKVSVDGGDDFGIGSSSASGSGWDVGFMWAGLPALLGLAAAVIVLLPKLSEVELPDLPFPWGLALLGAGVWSAFWVILKFLIGVDGPSSVSGFGVDYEVSRSIGIFLAVLSSIAFAVGGFMRFKEDGGELPTKGTGDTGGGTAPF
jgi:hypothetical protein